MAIVKGIYASAFISRILDELSDTGQNRWPSATILGYLNDGIDELARELAFVKTEIIPLSASVGHYETAHEVVRVISVVVDGTKLEPRVEDDLYAIYGEEWHGNTGTPEYFFPTPLGVRVVPAPSSSGSALTFNSSPSITEDEGATLNGSGYTASDNAGTMHNYLDGDGTVSGDTGTGLLRIKFNYAPSSLDTNHLVPTRFINALSAYVRYRCLSASDVPEEVAQAQTNLVVWSDAKEEASSYAQDYTLTAQNTMRLSPDISFGRRGWM